MKKKNLLAENMLRFKAKNLSETTKRKIVKLAEIITEQEAPADTSWNGTYSAGQTIKNPFAGSGLTNAIASTPSRVKIDSIDVTVTPAGTKFPSGRIAEKDLYSLKVKLSNERNAQDTIILQMGSDGKWINSSSSKLYATGLFKTTKNALSNIKSVLGQINAGETIPSNDFLSTMKNDFANAYLKS